MTELSRSIVGSQQVIKSLRYDLQSHKPELAVTNSVRMTYTPTGRLLLTIPPPPKIPQSSMTKSRSSHVEIAQMPKNRLFEEFFIISAPFSQVDSAKLTDFAYLPPTVIFQYPNLPENANW